MRLNKLTEDQKKFVRELICNHRIIILIEG